MTDATGAQCRDHGSGLVESLAGIFTLFLGLAGIGVAFFAPLMHESGATVRDCLDPCIVGTTTTTYVERDVSIFGSQGGALWLPYIAAFIAFLAVFAALATVH